MEEFGDGDALAAAEELAGGVVGFIEGGDAREGLFAVDGFDLNAGGGLRGGVVMSRDAADHANDEGFHLDR